MVNTVNMVKSIRINKNDLTLRYKVQGKKSITTSSTLTMSTTMTTTTMTTTRKAQFKLRMPLRLGYQTNHYDESLITLSDKLPDRYIFRIG